MKILPFAKRPEFDIIKIGNPNVGELYLQKLNGRKAIEREELDRVDITRTNSQLVLYKLAQKIAYDKNINLENALELILTSNEDQEKLLENYMTEVEEMLTLKKESEDLHTLIATVMLRERLAYPITFIGKVSNGFETEPLSFDVYKGDLIKFGKTTVEVLEDSYVGYNYISTNFSDRLQPNDVGFYMDSKTNREKIGFEDWSLEDTRNLRSELIEELVRFYETESSGGVTSTEKKEVSKKQSKSFKTSVTENP